MASNLTPIKQFSRVLACAAGILVFCHPLYGQAAGPTIAERPAALAPLQDKAAVEFIAEDLIDSETYVPTLFTADGKLEPLPARTRYYFAGDPVDGAAGTIVQDGDDYANTLLLADGTYRVYAADTFVHDPALDQWREIKTAETDPATFEAVMQAQIDPNLGDLLSGVFVAYADPLSPSIDGAMQCLGTPQDCHNDTNYDNLALSDAERGYGMIVWPDNMERNVYGFDFSALSGTVTAATFHAYFGNCYNSSDLYLVPSTYSGTTASNWSAFEYTDLGHASIANNQDNAIALNSTGLTYLSGKLGGDGILMMLSGSDFMNSGYGDFYCPERFSEYSGTTYDPYLELTVDEGGGDPDPEATSTPPNYASSTPGLTLETSIYMLFFTIVFCLSLFLGASVLADWFN